METKVAPITTKYRVEHALPFEISPALKELNIGGFADPRKQTIVNGVSKEAN